MIIHCLHRHCDELTAARKARGGWRVGGWVPILARNPRGVQNPSGGAPRGFSGWAWGARNEWTATWSIASI